MLDRAYKIFCEILKKYGFRAGYIDEMVKNKKHSECFTIEMMKDFIFDDLYMLFLNNEDDYEDFDDRIDICHMFMAEWWEELEEKLF